MPAIFKPLATSLLLAEEGLREQCPTVYLRLLLVYSSYVLALASDKSSLRSGCQLCKVSSISSVPLHSQASPLQFCSSHLQQSAEQLAGSYVAGPMAGTSSRHPIEAAQCAFPSVSLRRRWVRANSRQWLEEGEGPFFTTPCQYW